MDENQKEKMVNKNKRGELTSEQLIIIIILIISFAIILAFFFMLDLGGSIDKESCRNSVMMRGIPFGDWVVSLKCKTQDICFSMGGDCDAKTDNTIEVKNKDELVKEMVNLLADCWWMMGEGKVDYDDKGSCAICYKVYFDDEIKEKNPVIDYGDLSIYSLNKIPNKDMTYLSYLYGSLGEDDQKIVMDMESINTDEEYAVINKIEENKHPSLFVRFNADDLEKMKCSKYVTEV